VRLLAFLVWAPVSFSAAAAQSPAVKPNIIFNIGETCAVAEKPTAAKKAVALLDGPQIKDALASSCNEHQ